MSLLENLSKELIKVPMEAVDKEEAIDELLAMLDGNSLLSDLSAVKEAILAREAQGSTGLTDGIAIPHAKTKTVGSLCVAMGISPEGIDFESIDGAPSKIFFMILARPDQSSEHLTALAEISRMLQSKAAMRLLLASESPEEVLEVLTEE